jgi:hypothetical protein
VKSSELTISWTIIDDSTVGRTSLDPYTIFIDHAFNPSSSGARGRRIVSSRPASAELGRPCLKTKCKTEGLGWGHGSSGRVPALATIKPWVQTPVQPKHKNKTRMYV